MDGFKQVQLLVSKKDIENFKIIRENLDSLKLLVEEAELWVQKVPRTLENKSQTPAVRVRKGRGKAQKVGNQGIHYLFLCILVKNGVLKVPVKVQVCHLRELTLFFLNKMVQPYIVNICSTQNSSRTFNTKHCKTL